MRRLGLLVLACLPLTSACVHSGVGSGAALRDAAELRAVLGAATSPIQRFLAEARLTYFGHEGRVRTTATIAVARPGRFRLEVFGPHGGVIQAAACNGNEVFLLDVGANRFLHGPASPEALDEITALGPLHLGPEAWVGLFFGEVQVPPGAVLRHLEDDEVEASWEIPGGRARATFAGNPLRLRAAERVGGAGETVSRVVIHDRDANGLPASLGIAVPGDDVDVQIKLRDLELGPELGAEAFILDPPHGVTPEHLP